MRRVLAVLGSTLFLVIARGNRSRSLVDLKMDTNRHE
jgi:hypothetical protein